VGERRTTTHHAEIHRWVSEQGGEPTLVDGVLGFDFMDELAPASWHEWFMAFEEQGLAVVHDRDGTDFELVERSGR
jgi:hypothetical protein